VSYLATVPDGNIGISSHLDYKNHLVNARGLVDCEDIIASWKSRAAECVEWTCEGRGKEAEYHCLHKKRIHFVGLAFEIEMKGSLGLAEKNKGFLLCTFHINRPMA
jgi:hypothetical protein